MRVLRAGVAGNALAGNRHIGDALARTGEAAVAGRLKAQRGEGLLRSLQQDGPARRRADFLVRVDDGAQANLVKVKLPQRLPDGVEHDHDAALHVDDAAAAGRAVPVVRERNGDVVREHGIHVAHEHELTLTAADAADQHRAGRLEFMALHRKAEGRKVRRDHVGHRGHIVAVVRAAGLVDVGFKRLDGI